MRRSDLRSPVVRFNDRSTNNHASSARRLRDAGVITGFLKPLVGGTVRKFSSSAEVGGISRAESISIVFSNIFSFSLVGIYDLHNRY